MQFVSLKDEVVTPEQLDNPEHDESEVCCSTVTSLSDGSELDQCRTILLSLLLSYRPRRMVLLKQKVLT